MTASAAALMAKLMLVSLPLCLFLLDYWPPGRMSSPSGPRWRTMPRLLAEKLPLAVLAAAVAVLTFGAQTKGGALLAARTVHQVGFWLDDLSLYARAVAVSPESWFIRDEAIANFQEALRLQPGYAAARANLNFLLLERAAGC